MLNYSFLYCSYPIRTSRPFCSPERRQDDLASAPNPQTATGTPSRTTTSASGANTNTHNLGPSTSPQTQAAVWWWLVLTSSTGECNAATTEIFRTTQHVAASPRYFPICKWIDRLRSCSPRSTTTGRVTPLYSASLSTAGLGSSSSKVRTVRSPASPRSRSLSCAPRLRVPKHGRCRCSSRYGRRRPPNSLPIHKSACPHSEETAGGLAGSIRSADAQHNPEPVVGE